MKRMLLLIPLLMTLALLWRNGGEVNAAATCPSPVPSCTSSGTLSDLIGDFACTLVGTYSDGSVHVSLLELEFNGDGTGTALNQSSNNNSTGNTFSSWASPGALTYCLNTDAGALQTAPSATGFLTLPGAACPIAIIIDDGEDEVRLLDSSLNRALVGVCLYQ